jgi:peptide/nickel transport system permease protein
MASSIPASASSAPDGLARRIWRGWLRPVWPFWLLLSVFVIAALAAPWLAPRDPFQQGLLARLKPPGFEARGVVYLLGTDEIGRDLASRVIHGARVSLAVALSSVLLSAIVGTTLGVLAGYFRGWTETVLMRLTDMVLSIPAILMAIVMVAVLGPGFDKVVLVLAATRWPRYARVAYAQTLTVAGLAYVRAARLYGVSTARILLRHVLPNIAGPVVVVATLEFGLMVLFEAGLSFLGLGVQPPTPSWGAIMAVGRNYLGTAWWIATVPGVCLFLLALSVNMIGDHVRDRLDPRAG